MPVIKTGRPAEVRTFYEGFLGFRVAMDEDGMLMLASTSTPTTQVIVAWPSATAVDPELLAVDVSVEVADVGAAYEAAQTGGLQIVRELRDEPWGIRRFFIRDPSAARSTLLAMFEARYPNGVLLADRQPSHTAMSTIAGSVKR